MKTQYGIMINMDINSRAVPFINGLVDRGNVKREDLYAYLDDFRGTQVTDILLNVNAQMSMSTSAVFSDYAFKYEQTEEEGEPVDYKAYYHGFYKLNKEYGLDPYAVWIDRIREDGMRPWISLRMNDAHLPEAKTSFLRPSFYYEAKNNGWLIGERYGYYRQCFDYTYPEVRQVFLDYLAEQLTRYDVYGVELDFMRDIFCFDYVNEPDCHRIMTDFLREAKTIIVECAVKWGHPIVTSIRLMRDIAQNKIFGFDVEAINREKLCDVVVVTPRWASCDSDMPIDEWVRACPNLTVVAGEELLVNWNLIREEGGDPQITASMLRGYAATYFSEGSEGYYLFNHFFKPDEPISQEIYRTTGDYDLIKTLPRRYVVTYQEPDLVPAGCTGWHPLPLTADGKSLRVRLGCRSERAEIVIGLEKSDAINDLVLSVNGKTAEDFAPTTIAYREGCRSYAPRTTKLFRAPLTKEMLTEADLALIFSTIDGKEPLTVSYVEVDVK